MIAPEEFIAQFGSEKLALYNKTAVEKLNIPALCQQFLLEVGLPLKYYSGNLTFRAFPHLPLLGETFGADYPVPQESIFYHVFCTVSLNDWNPNNDVAKFYCLDDQTNGQVMQVSWAGETYWNVSFLNSGVTQFAEFLLLINEFEQWLRRRVDEQERSIRPFLCHEVDAKSHLVRQKLHRIDSNAFTVTREAEQYSAWEIFLLEMENLTGCM